MWKSNDDDENYDSMFRFVFLRHPFERLVSAFYDKFVEDPGVNFINILQALFANTLCQIVTKPNFNKQKAAHSTFIQKFARKMLMKLTPGVYFNKNLILSF